MEMHEARLVFNERGYAIAELLTGPDGRQTVVGYSLLGPEASESIIYASRLQALEALHDIEERLAGT